MLQRTHHHRASYRSAVLAVFVLAALCWQAPFAAAAERIKLGVIKTTSSGPIYIAIERGYFAAEGIEAELTFFDAAQPIAVATVSGDVDIGSTGLTAGFYALAGQGALRIIGAQGREAPGFHNLGYMVSNRAYESGVTSLKNIAGHSVAVSQTGAPGHYVIGALAEKYGVDLAKLRVLPLQSVPNIYSALTGGQADLGVTIITVPIMPSIDRGDLKILAWVGDEMAFQDRGFFVTTKTANERRDMIERFFRGYLKGVADYRAAFIGPDDKPKDGPTAPDILAIIGKYVGQPVAAIKLGIAYVDPKLQVNVQDILHQIAWYKSQGMLKSDVNGEDVLDKRYVIPLPQK